jgi:hypothetical protein
VEIVRHPRQRPPPPFDLAVERADVRREQAVQPQKVAFGFGKGGALVRQRIGKQGTGGGVDGGGDGGAPWGKSFDVEEGSVADVRTGC